MTATPTVLKGHPYRVVSEPLSKAERRRFSGRGDLACASDDYGWLAVVGARGHFASESVARGFLVLGPRTHHRHHHHLAEGIYFPLIGGTQWRMGDRGLRSRAAGEVIHHRPDVNHAVRTAGEPLLALYLWRGGPFGQKPKVSGLGGARS